MGTGHAPWRAAVLGAVLLSVAPATGCGEPSGGHGTDPAPGTTRPGARPTSPSSPSPNSPSSPTATSPEELCARLVASWSREVLDSRTYGDYQSMGLSNGQYEILMDVVDAARSERRRAGTRAALRLIDHDSRERCERRYRDGNPTGGPWS
ncbi:hypothetical protein AB0F07_23630 [Streptomyces fructofermentans]|uniref:hypothetical protein n=1 Tax=Streptomyces fructofermentans TaxID=152141 RepID=UPI0033C2AA99